MNKFVVVVENIPNMCSFITAWREMGTKCTDLRRLLKQMGNRKKKMNTQLEKEVINPCKKLKNSAGTFFERLESFKDKADKTLKQLEGGYKWNYFLRVQQVDHHLKEGQDLLSKADQLMKEGLTHNVPYTGGGLLPVGELIGNTTNQLLTEAFVCIKRRDLIIGIHGIRGAGKTNFLKFLHNNVCKDPENFKTIWVSAPEEHIDVKSMQDYLADALKFKLEDEDVKRRSALLANKLRDMAPGHIVLFLDNVKERFFPCKVGIPLELSGVENFYCTLVFTTASEDICNKMHCSTNFKLSLLPENEARELFLHEVGWNNRCTRSYNRRMKKVADDVIKQCACMPLFISQIARSMSGNEDLCAWRNRLNELTSIPEGIHNDEAKLLEQLKFGFKCIKDSTVWVCFLDSASSLLEGHQLTRPELIQQWIRKGIISRKRRRGAGPTPTDDQGHTIINELQRLYLLEAVVLDGTEYVRMNKWVRKMAEKIQSEEEDTTMMPSMQ